METEAETLSRIKALSQSAIKSEENANDLVDLLEYFQVAALYQERTSVPRTGMYINCYPIFLSV